LPWFLVYTRPRMEHSAQDNLLRQGFEVYLPLFKVMASTADGLRPAFEPMFPRYLLVRPSHAGQSLSTVRSTRGVHSLVHFGIEPARVPLETVQGIRALEARRSELTPEEISPLQPGRRVRVKGAALHGLEGLVQSVARRRVTFLLEILGRNKLVTVDADQVELA
jgi:transcriptional antiterminator RfaH